MKKMKKKRKKSIKKLPIKIDFPNDYDDGIIDDGDGMPQRYELDPEPYGENEDEVENEKEDFRITKERDFS